MFKQGCVLAHLIQLLTSFLFIIFLPPITNNCGTTMVKEMKRSREKTRKFSSLLEENKVVGCMWMFPLEHVLWLIGIWCSWL